MTTEISESANNTSGHESTLVALVDEADVVVGLHKAGAGRQTLERINAQWIPVPTAHPGFSRYESVSVSEALISVFDFERSVNRHLVLDDLELFRNVEVADFEVESESEARGIKLVEEVPTSTVFRGTRLSTNRWVAEVPGHVLVAAEAAIEALDNRDREILTHRLGAGDRRTLEEIGQNFGVVRERVRQLEKILIDKLEEPSLNNLVEACGFNEPFFMQRTQLEKFIPILGIRLAGDVSVLDVLVAKGSISRIVEGEHVWFGYGLSEIHVGMSRESSLQDYVAYLKTSGQPQEFVQAVLKPLGIRGNIFGDFLSDFGLMIFNGDVCSDTLTLEAFLLSEFSKDGRPMTKYDIEARLGGRWSMASCLNLLGTNDKFVRVDRASYALREWNLRQYRGIKEEILELVEKNGAMPVSEVVATLTSWFKEINEQSVVTYCTHPPLVISAGQVRIDDDVQREVKPLAELHHRSIGRLFRTPTGFVWRVDLTSDHLRGAGSAVALGIASVLGLQQGQTWEKSFDGSGAILKINFLRPQVEFGSIKQALDGIGAEVGDHFMIFFEGDEGNISNVWFELIPNERLSKDPAKRVMQLTGVDLDAKVPLYGVATALGLEKGTLQDLIAIAEARNDGLLVGELKQWEIED